MPDPTFSLVKCDELIDFVVAGMAARKYKSVIKRELIENLGFEISPGTYESLCRKARERIAVAATRRPKRFYEDAVTFYELVIADEKQPMSVRLRAQENLETIVGLRGKEGEQVSAEERAAQVQKALQAINDTDAGNP